MTTPRTIVTVGAGQTAAVAARNLRRHGFDGRIVLVGDEPYQPYQRPPLSKEFLTGTEAEDSLWILPEKWRTANDVELLTGTTVTHVDTSTRTIEFDNHPPLPADAVLFATGGTPRMLPVPGPRPDLVHQLRKLDDAKRLAEQLRAGRRLAIVGAGFIGLELAATATVAGVAVTVFESAPVPLAGAVGVEMGALVTRLHRDNGVDLRTASPVADLRTTAGAVLIDGEEFDAVVIGIGIRPNTRSAEASGLPTDDGIIVDAAGRTAVPGIYAAGDVARRFSARAGRHIRVEHFDNASRQGVAVAAAMLGRRDTEGAVNDDPHWFWSDQFGCNIQCIGTVTGEPVIRGDRDGLDFTAFYFDGPNLCGALSVERGEDISVTRELLGREIGADTLGDEDVDLWDLAYGETEDDSEEVPA